MYVSFICILFRNTTSDGFISMSLKEEKNHLFRTFFVFEDIFCLSWHDIEDSHWKDKWYKNVEHTFLNYEKYGTFLHFPQTQTSFVLLVERFI